MASRNKLPTEIIIILLKYTDSTTLRQCQLVCKEWCQSARLLIYRNIKFLSPSQLVRFVDYGKIDSSLGNLVKSVDFSSLFINNGFSYIPRKHFVRLAKLCPHVEVLLGQNASKEFWKTCYFLCLKYWTHLTHLPKLSKTDDGEYLTAAIACRNSLERLELWQQVFQNRGTQWTEFMASLMRTFKNLNSLKLRLFSYRDTISSFDTLLDQCPNLIKFNLLYLGVYRSIQEENQPMTDYTNISPLNTMKRLKITKGRFNSNAIKYLSHKFPQLQKIKFSFGGGSIYSKYSMEGLNEFFDYAMSIRHITMHMAVDRDDSFLLRLFTTRVGSPSIALSVVYEPQYTSHIHPGTPLTKLSLINNKNRNQSDSSGNLLSYTGSSSLLKYLPTPREQARVTIYCQRYPDHFPLQHKLILESLGNQFSYLYIDLQQYDKGRSSSLSSEYRLDHIFEHCPALKTLAYSSRHLVECDENIKINTSIKHLAFFGVEISDGIFPQLSIRLPSLERLQITGCHIFDIKNDTSKEINIDMPYTAFKSLHISESHCTANNKQSNSEVVYVDYFSRLYKVTHNSFLKISTLAGEQYFKLVGSKAYTVPLLECKSAPAELTKIHIRCKSIQSFTIVLGGLNIKQFNPVDPSSYFT